MTKVNVTRSEITISRIIGTTTIPRSNIKNINYNKGVFLALLRIIIIFGLIVDPFGTIRILFGKVQVEINEYNSKHPIVFYLTKKEHKDFISKY